MVKKVTAPPNPLAGARENKWVAAHRKALRRFAGRWIAVLGDEVVIDRSSITEVYDFLRSEALADALILKVPLDSAKIRHRIARASD